MLTKSQASALAKWRDGEPENKVFLKVRSDVFDRLHRAQFLRRAAWFQYKITDEGQAALAEFEAKHGALI
jgi:hypothetical protein